jgi:hypothetical protein
MPLTEDSPHRLGGGEFVACKIRMMCIDADDWLTGHLDFRARYQVSVKLRDYPLGTPLSPPTGVALVEECFVYPAFLWVATRNAVVRMIFKSKLTLHRSR